MKKLLAIIACGALLGFALTSSAQAQNCGCNSYQTPAISYGYAPSYSVQSPVYSQRYYSQPVYSRPIFNRFRSTSPSIVYSQPMQSMQPMSTFDLGMKNNLGGMIAMEAAMPASGICMQPCYNNCLAAGNSQSQCRQMCCQVMTMSVMAAPDGSDGICMQPCYNNCLAAGNSQAKCRELCCQASVTFEKINFAAQPESIIEPSE